MDVQPDGELDFRAVGRALWRKKLWILVPTVIVAIGTLFAVNAMTPRYKSEARILVEGRENVFMRPEAEKAGDRDRAVDQETVASQVQLVLSRDLARQVVKQLKLNERPEFDPVLRGVGPVRQALMLIGLAKNPLHMTPEERIFESYYDRVQAFPVDKSRVIVVEFQSADPDLAASAANAIAEAYLGLQQTVKQDQTKAASQWLAGEIESLRPKVAEAESKADDFRSKSNLFVGTNNSTLSNQQLGELSSQLAIARSQMAESDAKSRAIRDMLSAGRPIESGEIINSELIRRLNEQRVTLRGQLAEQSSTLLDGHPRIKELRAQIADLERQIRSEAERLVRSLENDAKIASSRVEQLSAGLDQLKRQAASSSGQDVQLRALEREAKAQRDLLESYLAKYREATGRENMAASPAEARVISRAVVSNTPYFPKKLPIVLIAVFATMLLGVGFITTGELLAGNVYRVGGVAQAEPPMAAAPQVVESKFVRAPESETVRTSAPAASLAASSAQLAVSPGSSNASVAAVAVKLRATPDRRSRAAVIGLAHDSETTSVPIALARALAAEGRVILVELAFAAPKVSSISSDPGAPGVADLVRGSASFGQIIARDRSSSAHVIAAGYAGPDAATILASERLSIALDALTRTYEHVIIDTGTLGDIPVDKLARLAPWAVMSALAKKPEAITAAAAILTGAGFAESMVLVARPDAASTSVASAAA